MTDNNKVIQCLFYLHNTFENNHYALTSFIKEMRKNAVDYSFAAKRFLDNSFGSLTMSSRHLLSEIPVWDVFWKKYDMLHAVFDGNPSLALCMNAYMFGVPYVLSFHGGYDTNCKIFSPDLKEKIIMAVHYSRYTTVVCASDKRALEELGCESEKIVITPPAIDYSVLPKEQRFDDERATVVGRFVEKKGIDTAIRALEYLPTTFSLDIIGDGELNDELHALSQQLHVEDRIRWHGELPLSDTLKIVSQNTFFWHPAKKACDGNAEGIPQILIYALALNRICISTYSGHIQDLLGGQNNGIMIEQNRPDLLSEATKRCKMSEIKEGGSNVEQYSIQAQLINWKKIYPFKREESQ